MSFNPATEDEELILIPPDKEESMGRKLHAQIMEHYPDPVDPAMQYRVRNIGYKLSDVAERKNIVYRFTVLQSDKKNNYNAFATPGGYIYIFDTFVKALKNDDLIAAVLAHEMAHGEALHAVKRAQGSAALTALMFVSTQVEKQPGTTVKFNSAMGHLVASYSRNDERQADELAVKYMKKAGFEPSAVVGAMECMQDLHKNSRLYRYATYKSHPYLSERISYLKKIVNGRHDFDSYSNLTIDDPAFQ